MIDYRIIPKELFTNKVGELVCMLEHTRDVTLSEISNLKQRDLDYLLYKDSNTIGALLIHIASIEYVHQIVSFENRDLSKDELQTWETALGLGNKAREEITGNAIDYYLDVLSNVRKSTLRYFKTIEDNWLYEENKWENGVTHNNYYLWYHVMEDEINHRGQIRTIKRLLTNI